MASWSDFEAAAPALAARGRTLLTRTGIPEGMLTTVAGDAPPRTHPVVVGVVDGHLVVFSIDGSPKTRDLVADGRYALHTHLDPDVPHEFLLRGRATAVADPAVRQAALDSWSFDAGDGYQLFELGIEHALLGERDTRDDWPPRYTRWHASSA